MNTNFKPGDVIIQLEDCCDNKKGKKYTLKRPYKYSRRLIADSGSFDSCSCDYKWIKLEDIDIQGINGKSYLNMLRKK